jgi:uncharacterized protein (TIGR03382 family)
VPRPAGTVCRESCASSGVCDGAGACKGGSMMPDGATCFADDGSVGSCAAGLCQASYPSAPLVPPSVTPTSIANNGGCSTSGHPSSPTSLAWLGLLLLVARRARRSIT